MNSKEWLQTFYAFKFRSYCSFLDDKQKKMCHALIKGGPISIEILHFPMKLDGSPTNSEMNLDNSMTIGMLPYPRNVGTHLNWREGQWKYRVSISFSLILAILYDSPAVAGA